MPLQRQNFMTTRKQNASKNELSTKPPVERHTERQKTTSVNRSNREQEFKTTITYTYPASGPNTKYQQLLKALIFILEIDEQQQQKLLICMENIRNNTILKVHKQVRLSRFILHFQFSSNISQL